MDIATLVGLLAGTAIVLVAIFIGGDFGTFVNVPSILIVVGGGLAATVIRFTLTEVMQGFKTGIKVAFKQDKATPQAIIESLTDLARIARKDGPLGLEQVEIEHEYQRKGVQFLIDGLDHGLVQAAMERERELIVERLVVSEKVFRALADAAPAFGMIGTLVGLVQMLSTMDDPAKIGPAMAVALLTTLYGSLIASIIANPIADKLQTKAGVEELNLALMAEGVSHIQNKVHPDLMIEFLNAYLPANKRMSPQEQAA